MNDSTRSGVVDCHDADEIVRLTALHHDCVAQLRIALKERDSAYAKLAALREASKDWQLMPKRPTREMLLCLDENRRSRNDSAITYFRLLCVSPLQKE